MLPKKCVIYLGIFFRGSQEGGVRPLVIARPYIFFFMLTLFCRTKTSLSSLKSKVASVLLSIPGGRVHLIKFRELYDKRYTIEKRWDLRVSEKFQGFNYLALLVFLSIVLKYDVNYKYKDFYLSITSVGSTAPFASLTYIR